MRVPAILCGLLAVCPLIPAQSPLTAWEIPREEAATQSALVFRQHRLPGRDLLREVKKLTKELDWKSSLKLAQKDAQETGKPIFLVQALGTLAGYT